MKPLKVWLLFFLILSPPAFGVPVAPVVSSGLGAGETIRVFRDFSSYTLMAEGNALQLSDSRDSGELTLGGYDQFTNSLSAGIFYQRAWGLRHDDDWIDNNGIWQWQNSRWRGEDFAIGDLTLKFNADFLPGTNWIAELKSRYLIDFFNGERTIMLRPGLTYFWLRDDQLVANFFLQFEADLPQNYHSNSINERWLYVGALFRIFNNVDFGAFYALQWQQWSPSRKYLDKQGSPYSVSATDQVINALLIFH